MACRYPFDYPGVPKLQRQGLRGASAGIANQVWGMNNAQYVRIADLWPLNPKGEILFGLKIEDTFANANADASLAVPGVSFAEWGPTDNNYWLSGFDGLPLDGSRFDETKFPKMMAIHDKVLALCKKNNVKYLNLCNAHARLQQCLKPDPRRRHADGRQGGYGADGAAIHQAQNAHLTYTGPERERSVLNRRMIGVAAAALFCPAARWRRSITGLVLRTPIAVGQYFRAGRWSGRPAGGLQRGDRKNASDGSRAGAPVWRRTRKSFPPVQGHARPRRRPGRSGEEIRIPSCVHSVACASTLGGTKVTLERVEWKQTMGYTFAYPYPAAART